MRRVRPAGFEPATLGSEDRCAIQLRHGRKITFLEFTKSEAPPIERGFYNHFTCKRILLVFLSVVKPYLAQSPTQLRKGLDVGTWDRSVSAGVARAPFMDQARHQSAVGYPGYAVTPRGHSMGIVVRSSMNGSPIRSSQRDGERHDRATAHYAITRVIRLLTNKLCRVALSSILVCERFFPQVVLVTLILYAPKTLLPFNSQSFRW